MKGLSSKRALARADTGTSWICSVLVAAAILVALVAVRDRGPGRRRTSLQPETCQEWAMFGRCGGNERGGMRRAGSGEMRRMPYALQIWVGCKSLLAWLVGSSACLERAWFSRWSPSSAGRWLAWWPLVAEHTDLCTNLKRHRPRRSLTLLIFATTPPIPA